MQYICTWPKHTQTMYNIYILYPYTYVHIFPTTSLFFQTSNFAAAVCGRPQGFYLMSGSNLREGKGTNDWRHGMWMWIDDGDRALNEGQDDTCFGSKLSKWIPFNTHLPTCLKMKRRGSCKTCFFCWKIWEFPLSKLLPGTILVSCSCQELY